MEKINRDDPRPCSEVCAVARSDRELHRLKSWQKISKPSSTRSSEPVFPGVDNNAKQTQLISSAIHQNIVREGQRMKEPVVNPHDVMYTEPYILTPPPQEEILDKEIQRTRKKARGPDTRTFVVPSSHCKHASNTLTTQFPVNHD